MKSLEVGCRNSKWFRWLVLPMHVLARKSLWMKCDMRYLNWISDMILMCELSRKNKLLQRSYSDWERSWIIFGDMVRRSIGSLRKSITSRRELCLRILLNSTLPSEWISVRLPESISRKHLHWRMLLLLNSKSSKRNSRMFCLRIKRKQQKSSRNLRNVRMDSSLRTLNCLLMSLILSQDSSTARTNTISLRHFPSRVSPQRRSVTKDTWKTCA